MHHASQGAHIKKELLEKMFKELTILGFVAFSATVLLQATHCTPSTYTTYTNLHPLARARAYWHACHAHIHILARAPRTYFGPRAARETLPVASYTNLGGTAHPESRAAPQLRVLAHSHVLDRHRLRQGDLGLPLILTLSLTPTAAVDLTPTLTLTPALTSILTRRSSLSQRC